MTTMTHTKGTTTMNITYTSTTIELVEFLTTSIKEGIIYNSDYTMLKDILGRRFEDQVREIRDAVLKVSPYDGNRRDWADGAEELYYDLPYGLYQASKLFKSKLTGLDRDLMIKVAGLTVAWEPIREALYVTAKPLIVKTRKPNPDSESKDARTLENTGTCPICNGNFKRDSKGRIVRHGYKVEGREYHGSCYGDGFQPWEVSPVGVEKYLTLLERTVCSLENQQSSLIESPPESLYDKYRRVSVAKDEAGYERLLLSRQADVASQLRQVASDLQYFTKKLHNWTPGTLPGILAGFDK
jgi:hypothetical protein